jgi:hypothetical protein
MLDIDQIHSSEFNYIEGNESHNIDQMIKRYVFDSDAVSSYPSSTLAANLSKDTTVRELIDIENIDFEEVRLNNINLVFGKVNNVAYMTNICKYPTLENLEKLIS